MSARAGDWVEVRSKEEILATLDKSGRLDGMPFMPEMFSYCGKRLKVYRRAHKSCDTINPVSSRSIPNSVLLDGVRCDGAAHDGCQAACSVFWKQAWLKPLTVDAADPPAAPVASGAGCTAADVQRATRDENDPSGRVRYSCQATDFPKFSTLLPTGRLGQYVEDVSSGNVGLGELVKTTAYFAYDFFFRPEKRWRFALLYDRFAKLWGGVAYPRRWGGHPEGEEPGVEPLDLQPGDMVRVKPYEEILGTLTVHNRSRGLYFDAEMVPYCGGVFRVRSRIEHFVDEFTGYMRRMKTPAVILEGVWCLSRFSNHRAFCPRAIYSWWRESWLERVPVGTEATRVCLGTKIPLPDDEAVKAAAEKAA